MHAFYIQIKVEPKHLTGAIEDEESLKCHLESLNAERGKLHPNREKVAELMQITFAHRRQEIEEGLHVVEILKRYPFLEEVDVVCPWDCIYCMYNCSIILHTPCSV